MDGEHLRLDWRRWMKFMYFKAIAGERPEGRSTLLYPRWIPVVWLGREWREENGIQSSVSIRCWKMKNEVLVYQDEGHGTASQSLGLHRPHSKW
jgi:hypothetical protein